jgi:hypothetical protein
MASTYEPIATTTLGSAAASYTFSSIPNTYTDLVLIVSAKLTSGGAANHYYRVNSDTGSNYSTTRLYGTGTTAGSDRGTNLTYIFGGDITANEPVADIIQFNNYSNTTTYKTILVRNNPVSSAVHAIVGLWRSTSAINSITATTPSSTFAVGSTFTLYGIKAA